MEFLAHWGGEIVPKLLETPSQECIRKRAWGAKLACLWRRRAARHSSWTLSRPSALAPDLHFFIPLSLTTESWSMSNAKVSWRYEVLCSDDLCLSFILTSSIFCQLTGSFRNTFLTGNAGERDGLGWTRWTWCWGTGWMILAGARPESGLSLNQAPHVTSKVQLFSPQFP